LIIGLRIARISGSVTVSENEKKNYMKFTMKYERAVSLTPVYFVEPLAIVTTT
jgi:hypothetical protein